MALSVADVRVSLMEQHSAPPCAPPRRRWRGPFVRSIQSNRRPEPRCSFLGPLRWGDRRTRPNRRRRLRGTELLGPGLVAITIIPGGGSFFTEKGSGPSFGNYALGGAVTY